MLRWQIKPQQQSKKNPHTFDTKVEQQNISEEKNRKIGKIVKAWTMI